MKQITISRRQWLQQSANGFGWLAATALLSGQSIRSEERLKETRVQHHPPKAKHVIFLFMDGGPSQVDTLDPKPRLQAEHGQPFKLKQEATQFDNRGNTLGSPFKFSRHGQSGIELSEIFPHLGTVADELCVIRSMRAQFPEHSQACYFMHSGHPLQGRPSLGSWTSYALGSEAQDLPGYVVLGGGMIPLGGVANYSSGFLPAIHEGSLFDVTGAGPLLANVKPAAASVDVQRRMLDFAREADQEFVKSVGSGESAIESAIRNAETAAAMQLSVPSVADLQGESQETLKLYGVDSTDPLLARYSRQCLLARRLIERGVRFIELSCVSGLRFVSPWDDHEDLEKGHRRNASVVDQPIAALIKDLKSRGLLQDTLIVWAGEFGRTPFAQGSIGRDHNPQGFSIWLAGGGIKGGMTYGATDEYGYHAIENIVTVHDLHATLLHQLGLDHERLTFRYSGRDFRLTDVHGRVVQEILA